MLDCSIVVGCVVDLRACWVVYSTEDKELCGYSGLLDRNAQALILHLAMPTVGTAFGINGSAAQLLADV